MYAWCGCAAPYNGVLPEKCLPYIDAHSKNITAFENYLDSLADDLAKGFDLGMAYYEKIDSYGHWYEPDSLKVYEAVQELDSALGKFMDNLAKLNLESETDVIIVSDHGMSAPKDGYSIPVTQFLDPELIDKAVERSTFMHIALKNTSQTEEAVRQLSRFPGIQVYAKKNIPDHLGFRDNDMIFDILLISNGPAYIQRDYHHANKFLPKPWKGEGCEFYEKV